MRLAVFVSHPIQYYSPIFAHLASLVGLHVFYLNDPTPRDQANAGFDTEFTWDIDLLNGYKYSFLNEAGFREQAGISISNFSSIFGALKSGKFDAVLVIGWYLHGLRLAILASKILKLPVMVRGDSHLDTKRSTFKTLARKITFAKFLSLIDGFLYVGVKNQEYYKHYRINPSSLFYSPHCIDTHRFTLAATQEARTELRLREGIEPSETVVLFAGKLLPFKRPLDVVDAIGLLKSQGLSIRMMIAGSGPLEEEIRIRCETLGIALTFLGFQNQTQMPAAYAAADLLVLPSDGRETWGLVANEALACGLPIIVSDQVGCAPDLARDGVAGRTFPVGDVRALASEIAAGLTNPPPSEAIERISNAHSIAVAGQGILEAMASLTNRPGK